MRIFFVATLDSSVCYCFRAVSYNEIISAPLIRRPPTISVNQCTPESSLPTVNKFLPPKNFTVFIAGQFHLVLTFLRIICILKLPNNSIYPAGIL